MGARKKHPQTPPINNTPLNLNKMGPPLATSKLTPENPKQIGSWNALKQRAEAAERALAERTEASMHWELRFHQTLGERDDLRAELEKMKSDRDQFADEVDELRAKVDELTPRHISDGWRADRSALLVNLWMFAQGWS